MFRNKKIYRNQQLTEVINFQFAVQFHVNFAVSLLVSKYFL